MGDALYLIMAAVIWQNVVLTGLLGLTPFLAEREPSLVRGATIGLCATVIMTIAVGLNAVLGSVLLVPHGLEMVTLLVFSGVLLALGAGGALLDRLLRRRGSGGRTASAQPPRWRVYLPESVLDAGLIGAGLIAMGSGGAEAIGEAVLQAFAAGLGFTAVLLVMEGIRERLMWLRPSNWLAGVPIQLITLGILALIITGFRGI